MQRRKKITVGRGVRLYNAGCRKIVIFCILHFFEQLILAHYVQDSIKRNVENTQLSVY